MSRRATRQKKRCVAHCFRHSYPAKKPYMQVSFAMRDLCARRFPRARAADPASAFLLLSLRVRGPSQVAVVLSESDIYGARRLQFFTQAVQRGPAKRGREPCRTEGAKEIKFMLGRSCAWRDFAHSESFNFASCKRHIYVRKLEEKNCLIRERFLNEILL